MVIQQGRIGAAALAAAMLSLMPGTALAQAYQCAVPAASAPLSVPQVEQDGPTRLMPVAGYTLALSWSPEFCRTREDSARNARQCSGQDGRFGFIVHGLWPNGRGESWPQWCPTSRQPGPAALRQNLCMTPDTRLLAHEWAKHGSCMVGTPETYFSVTRVLWNSLRFPDFDRLSRREGLTAGAIREAFADANPHWEAEHVGLKVNERGWLEEMRLCYDRRFRPARCTPRRYGPEDGAAVRIWRGL
ncbi:ribonuclease T [Altererythrobacter sp. KTW20L]|uniref:ribonuclease T2 family protein n=1 Tax=Altererythrobacter sp. KTW20L TaxID=2942210 RepID=UPI0020C170A4|nr:ribonuclease T [Altererythrobacter sp. KTW20L]MCL6250018.1 ribonuclease T [Altererythrobacter sp. KTW20L]